MVSDFFERDNLVLMVVYFWKPVTAALVVGFLVGVLDRDWETS